MRLTLGEVLEATGGAVSPGAEPELGFEAVSTDTRSPVAGSLFVALVGPRFDGHDFVAAAAARGAAGVLVSRSCAPAGLTEIRVPDTLAALGALGRSVRRRLSLRVVAVTGSVGKTTTKDMAAAMLRAAGRRVLQTPGNLNNRIGLPLTLLGARGDEESAVLELGISEPGEMAHLTRICEPDVAVVTTVAPAHTEGLGGLEGVAREKLAVVGGLRPGGALVLPHGHELLAPPAGVRAVTFGWSEDADLRGERLELLGVEGCRFVVGGQEMRVPLPGRHNADNALAALAAVRELGVDWAQAAAGLASLRAAALRGEVREGAGGTRLLVDCYNANPLAMEAALETLAALAGTARKLAVLGEMKELGALAEEGHARVGRAAARHGVERLYLLGEATRSTRDAATASGLAPEHVRVFADGGELASAVRRDAAAGDWILLKGSRAMGLEAVADALGRERSTTDQRPRTGG